MLRPLKEIIKPIYWSVNKHPLYRKLRTVNYTSGKVLLGERNTYFIGRNWVTVDIEGADFNVELNEQTRLPFADGSQSVIYSAHMIEHLNDSTLKSVIGECFRILKSGGYIRFEAPDAERIIVAYQTNDRPFIEYFAEDLRNNLVQGRGFPEEYGEDHIGVLGLLSCYIVDDTHVPVIASRAEFDERIRSLNIDDFGKWCASLQTPEQLATHGHANAIHFEKMQRLLADAGFGDIQRKQNRETDIPHLRLEHVEREHRSFYSIYVEARK